VSCRKQTDLALCGGQRNRVIRNSDHERLSQLGKTLLRVIERQELLLDIPAAKERMPRVVAIEGLSRAS